MTLKKKFKIYDEQDLCRIGIVNEIPIVFEMYQKKTVEKICNKTVTIRTLGTEKARISLILCILSNGFKLPPMIVFKGKMDGTLIKKLEKHPLVKNNKVYVVCQPNSWADSSIFLIWLKDMWFNESLLKPKKNTLLVFDRCTSHY